MENLRIPVSTAHPVFPTEKNVFLLTGAGTRGC
jgi:hypothetical protein